MVLMRNNRSLDLSAKWKNSGINEGDCVLLHSNIKRLTKELLKSGDKKPVDTILDSFIDAVGAQGTLIIPLFNFELRTGSIFDAKKTVSQMGSLTEKARLRCNGERSGHPFYSFCAFGKYADHIHKIDNESAYSDESPFGFLRKVNGKIASLDLEDQGSMTFYHHVEELSHVEYRFMKWFDVDYISKDLIRSSKSYSIYVRDIKKGVVTNVNPAGEQMWIEGIYKGDRPNIGSGLRIVNSNDFFEFVKNIITSGRAEGMLFSYS